MFRLVFWIIIIIVALWLWRRIRQRSLPRTPAEPRSLPMVRCHYCGLHVPRERALSARSHWYCCQAHLDQDQPLRND